MQKPANKEEFLFKIQYSHDNLEQLLSKIEEDLWTIDGVIGDWSLKDLLVHIMDWEQYTIQRIFACSHGRTPRLRDTSTDEKIAVINQEIVQENKKLPLDRVRADFERSYREILSVIADLSESDLFDLERGEAVICDPQHPVWMHLYTNTIEHYEEHIPQIEEWLKKQRSS